MKHLSEQAATVKEREMGEDVLHPWSLALVRVTPRRRWVVRGGAFAPPFAPANTECNDPGLPPLSLPVCGVNFFFAAAAARAGHV